MEEDTHPDIASWIQSDPEASNTFFDGLWNEKSYKFRLKGRGQDKDITLPLYPAFAIELRVRC